MAKLLMQKPTAFYADQIEWIERQAHYEDRSFASIVRQAVELYRAKAQDSA